MSKSKYYVFAQSNSGGGFIENEDVQANVVIEGNSSEEASHLLEDITWGYTDYCPCCGVRWGYFPDEEFDNIDEFIKDKYWSSRGGSVIYHLNGTKEVIDG